MLMTPGSLRGLLDRLLDSFDRGADEPPCRGVAVGLMAPPASEAWTPRLESGRIALLRGPETAEIVIQAPLDVFCVGWFPAAPGQHLARSFHETRGLLSGRLKNTRIWVLRAIYCSRRHVA